MEELFRHSHNFAGLSSPYSDLMNARVAILPVPYDSTTEWHSGTREGPRAIINASQYLEMYDMELGREICEVGIHTLPEVQPMMNSPEEMIQRVYDVASKLIHDVELVVMLGGEHSISTGMVRALKENYNDICVLQLDAHADLRDEYQGSKYSHACVMRRIIEFCPVTQVGIRSLSLEEKDFIDRNKLNVFYSSNFGSLCNSLANIVDSLTGDVYVSIDLDAFDPSIMAAVGTPVPGGLQWHEVLDLLKLVALKKRVVGFDIVELCPGEGPASCAFLAAMLAYKFVGYVTLLRSQGGVA